ncbi:MAG: hypothetical protein D6725_14825 [Planctomycetota bacterium]|nr:MAG: hypothetical protein D6725_14825 [Planctomycetota bacterium]
MPVREAWRRRLVRGLQAWEIDRAVLYALLQRGWQFIAGGVTLLLVAACFDRRLQGYYYTVAGLLALQSFAELGLHAVIVYVTSHEWPRLGGIEPTETVTNSEPTAWHRTAAVWKYSLQWYTAVAAAFIVILGPIGAWFLDAGEVEPQVWRAPWWSGIVGTAGTLLLLPSVAVLEGCNQVAVVNGFRLGQAMAASFMVWAGILRGHGLWVLVWAIAARVGAELLLVAWRFRSFFVRLWRTPPLGFSWKRELWPLQWRVAVQTALSYFSVSYAVPVVFRVRGAVWAGRIGMTWAVLTTLQLAASAWVHTRAPELGGLLAEGRTADAYRLYRRILVRSLQFLAASGAAFVIVVVALELALPGEIADTPPNTVGALLARLSRRLLPWAPTLLLATGTLGYHLVSCAGVFVRIHKADPLLPVVVLHNLLLAVVLPPATWWGGVMGLAIAYAVVTWTVAVPGCWAMARRIGRSP